MKKEIEKARAWALSDPTKSTPASTGKGDGSFLRTMVSKEHIKDPILLRAVKASERIRKELAEVSKLQSGALKREETERIKREYFEQVESWKRSRVVDLMVKLDEWKQGHESGELYRDTPELIQLDSLNLRRFELRAAAMDEAGAMARIEAGKRSGIYSEDEILTLISKSEKTAEAARDLFNTIPPAWATSGAREAFDELESLRSAGPGNLPYESAGVPGVADVMPLLNEPVSKEPPKASPTDPAAVRRAFEIERQNKQDKERKEEIEEIRKLRRELETQVAG